jgi:hypothetical protein
MTILQPHKQIAYINYVLGALVFAVFASALSLVFVYNSFVDTSHRVSGFKKDITRMETESALLRDTIFALTVDVQSESLANQSGLVKDKSPHYLTLDPQWSLALR